MEDDKPIIIDYGLREAFEHPLNEWPNLQNIIPASPEKMDYLNDFTYRSITYFSVLRYLFNHNPSILPLIIEKIKHDYLKNIPDLTSHEIYEIVSHLSLNNSKVLLQQKFELGVYTSLIDAIQKKDEKSFVDALNGCDLTNIMHILKILHVPIKLFRAIETLNLNLCNNESANAKELFERFRFYYRKSLIDVYGEDSKKASRLARSTADSLRSIEDDSELIKYIERYYSLLYGVNCFLKKTELFDETEISVLEYILKSMPLQESYNQIRIYWENGELKERFDGLTKELFEEKKPQPEIVFRKRKRKRICGRPISNSDWMNNDSNVEDGEIIEDIQPRIVEFIPLEPRPEQVSPSDGSDPESPNKLTKEQKDIIDDFDIGPNYFNNEPNDSDDHCIITNEQFNALDAEKKAKMFEAFIKMLAKERYIAPDKGTMKSYAYAFTGIGFKAYRGFHVQPVFWNKEKVDVLLYICMKFYRKNEKTNAVYETALKVFHVTAEGNLNTRAKKIKGKPFDTKFTKIFSEL